MTHPDLTIERRDPRVTLCFEDEMTWVGLRGTVQLDDDREVDTVVRHG